MIKGKELEEAHRRIVQWISQKIQNTGKKGVVLGLSGGVDSALSLSLAVDALGAEHVMSYYLPYEGVSRKADQRDARKMCRDTRTLLQKIEISTPVDRLAALTGAGDDKVRLGNLMARVRMTILFDKSAQHDYLVMGTANLSESLMGYATHYGDNACAFTPLGNLLKTEVWSMAQIVDIPDSILEKEPTAGLWKDQTDKDEMGIGYDQLDTILEKYLRGEDPKTDQEKEIFSRIKSQAFKREMSPDYPTVRS